MLDGENRGLLVWQDSVYRHGTIENLAWENRHVSFLVSGPGSSLSFLPPFSWDLPGPFKQDFSDFFSFLFFPLQYEKYPGKMDGLLRHNVSAFILEEGAGLLKGP